MSHITVSTLNLTTGDIVFGSSRVVSRVERNPDNLGAATVFYADGSWNFFGVRDAHVIVRG